MPFKKTHGMSGTKIYQRWRSMVSRCHNKNSSDFFRYGAVGISVCKEWHKFEKYLEWANNNGYSDDLTLDRIDEKGNYEPSNCQYISQHEQVLKQKRNKHRIAEDKHISKTKWGTYMVTIQKSRSGFKNFKPLLVKTYKTLENAKLARDTFLKTGQIIPNEDDLAEIKKKEDLINYKLSKSSKITEQKRIAMKRKERAEYRKKIKNNS
jgi:hypothetical protein